MQKEKFDNSYSLLVTQSCINCCRCSFSWIWPRFFSRSLFLMCSFFNFLTNCSFSSLSWKGRELKKKNQATFSNKVLIELIIFQIKITSQKFYYGYLELYKYIKQKDWKNNWLQTLRRIDYHTAFLTHLLKASNVIHNSWVNDKMNWFCI